MSMIEHETHPAADDTVGGRISLARESAGLSMSDAARALGILKDTWMAWECDRDLPRGSRLTMMAGLLAVSPSWLLAGVGQGPMERSAMDDGEGLQQALQQASEEVALLNQRLARIQATLSAGVPG